MGEVLISGKRSFKIEVPYKLIETGQKGAEKPLIVYLHGYKQNLPYLRRKIEDLLSVEAYHLLIQGPYPIYDESRKRKVKDWGHAWYLYDGDQNQFIKSMEISSEFIQDLIDSLSQQITISRIALFGYSMGGYLAGYFALSKPNYINDLMIIGGRVKTELFSDKTYPNLQVLALHGLKDESVAADRQQKSLRDLEKLGATITLKLLDESHRLTEKFIEETKNWLVKNGYSLKK